VRADELLPNAESDGRWADVSWADPNSHSYAKTAADLYPNGNSDGDALRLEHGFRLGKVGLCISASRAPLCGLTLAQMKQ
jgi:hypothetical protein